jgi:hypothetical protein
MPCTAPKAATCEATGTDVNTGPPRRNCRSNASMRPLRAAIAASYPGTSASGPSGPQPVIEQWTSLGCSGVVAS